MRVVRSWNTSRAESSLRVRIPPAPHPSLESREICASDREKPARTSLSERKVPQRKIKSRGWAAIWPDSLFFDFFDGTFELPVLPCWRWTQSPIAAANDRTPLHAQYQWHRTAISKYVDRLDEPRPTGFSFLGELKSSRGSVPYAVQPGLGGHTLEYAVVFLRRATH